ncbi:unnamed protein product [Protopolystoma xenopodis]|uniref:Uncharacterized protein n=1 Tax=Protopolystoma xenopodis TaxID=117903 RepID=A0A448XG30_9PLAT|nr:unnamed protein product [Protopolystoma xenopodis]
MVSNLLQSTRAWAKPRHRVVDAKSNLSSSTSLASSLTSHPFQPPSADPVISSFSPSGEEITSSRQVVFLAFISSLQHTCQLPSFSS